MDVVWSGRHETDPRTATVRSAINDAVNDPERVAPIEDFRRRLAADRSVFDDIEGKPITVSRMARVASSGEDQCRFLHVLAANHMPATVVEMGTAVGISAAYIGTALAPDAKMWTVDVRAASARYAQGLFDEVGVEITIVTGSFNDVLEGVLRRAAPVDLLFVDGHHQEKPTLDYTDMAWPYLSTRALVVFDDIRWSDGMERAWEALRHQPRWSFTVDCGLWGLCAVDPGQMRPRATDLLASGG